MFEMLVGRAVKYFIGLSAQPPIRHPATGGSAPFVEEFPFYVTQPACCHFNIKVALTPTFSLPFLRNLRYRRKEDPIQLLATPRCSMSRRRFADSDCEHLPSQFTRRPSVSSP
jgi:hypothetical protein